MEQKTKSGFSLYVNSNENIQNALFLREKKKKYRICIAQGLSKVDSMLGALNGGFINVLITNEETADWILKQDDYMNP